MIPLTAERVFCDTSFFFATLDPHDTHHAAAQERVQVCAEQRVSLLTTWEVLGETLTLLRYRLGASWAARFLDEVRPSLQLIAPSEAVREEALLLFRRSPLRLSYCDALSCLVVTSVLHRIPCLAFDDDFRHLGLHVI
jgi:predicted nucleic acid-binding protein